MKLRRPAIPVLNLLMALAGPAPRLQASPALSTAPTVSPDSTAVLPTTAAARLVGQVDIDGILDEEAWAAASVATGFIQQQPLEGEVAEVQTEVRVLFSDNALYVAARMLDPEPSTIADQLVRRDEDGQFDRFTILLDPNLDRRTGYLFQVSASNVQADRYLSNDTEEDRNWNAVWASATRTDDQGWTAEIRIPLSQIRYDRGDDPQTWGVNFSRRRVATEEISFFSLESRVQQGRVSRFGRLEGVEVPRSARRLEGRPYMLSSVETAPAEEGDPFFDGRAADARVGLDFRWGVTSNFTLDATINPDFGQVEADPAVINLTAFEQFFEERRPFFVEDARVFDFELSGRQNQLYYSRRIGRNPHGGEPSGASFSTIPQAASIIGAAKFTGRTPGGLSVGGLFAVTEEEFGQAYYAEDDEIRDFRVEPRSEYGVVRLQQDLRGGDTQIGGIFTGMHRDLPSDGSFDWLTSQAYTLGADFEHTWDNRNYAFSGFLGSSMIRGDSTALIRVQRQANHLFQRPDAEWVEMDSTRTSMSAAEWRLELEKRGGDHWTWGVWAGQVVPGFEINDLGFSTNQERLDGGMRVGYREIQPGRIFRDYRINFWTFHNWSHEALNDATSLDSWKKAHKNGSFSLSWNNTFLNYHALDVNLRARPNMYSFTQTRGGPVMAQPGNRSISIRYNTDPRKAYAFFPEFEYARDTQGSGSRYELGLTLEFRPSSRLELSIEGEWGENTNYAQYVTTSDVLEYEPTYGTRYLFAELDRETVEMDFRVNYAFSPTLTLEGYAQILLSAGDYVQYKQLEETRSFAFDEFEEGQIRFVGDEVHCQFGRICYDSAEKDQWVDFDGDGIADDSFGDRDFNFRSLRSNVVLRWEYRPGSTVFLVWQQDRSNREVFGNFDFDRDFGGLWALEGQNLFMVKVNYWLGL
jgi:hypothetical protein